MIPHPPRSLGYYANSHWLQVAVLFTVLGSLVMGLLWALSDVTERAEKQVVELTVRNMKTGMQLAMGEALLHQRANEVASWVDGNPVLWLGSQPSGYRGQCSAEESRSLEGGEWCFELGNRELVYRPKNANHLRNSVGERDHQCEQLGWHVVRTSGSAASGDLVGLRIEATSSCQWVLE